MVRFRVPEEGANSKGREYEMRRIRIVAIVAVSLFVCASVGVAQDGPAGFLYVVRADVKPGMAGQYEGLYQEGPGRSHGGS